MKKGLTVFAISTLLCGGLAIADGGHQAFAKGGKESSSSSSSHSSSRGSSSHGSSYGRSKRGSSKESLFDGTSSLTYGKSRGRSSFGLLSNRSSRVGTSSKTNNKNRYSNGIATRMSNQQNNLSNRKIGTSNNLTNSRFDKTRDYGKTTGIGSNNIVTKNFRSNFVTRRGAGLHKNRTRNNIVISNKTLQNNRHNQTQLNVVSPNVSKFRSRIFRGQNMTFYRTNNNQLIQLPNEN